MARHNGDTIIGNSKLAPYLDQQKQARATRMDPGASRLHALSFVLIFPSINILSFFSSSKKGLVVLLC